MNKNVVFIFSHCTAVTPAHMGHFSHYMYHAVYTLTYSFSTWWHTRHRGCKSYFWHLVWWRGPLSFHPVCAEQAFPRHWFFIPHVEKKKERPSQPLSVEVRVCSAHAWKDNGRHLSSGVLSVTGEVLMWDHWRCLFSTSSFIIKKANVSMSALSILVRMDWQTPPCGS